MRTLTLLSICFALLTSAAPRTGSGYVSISKIARDSPEGAVFHSRVHHVSPLADGSMFAVYASDAYEPNAELGSVIEPDGTVIPIRITEFLPGGKFVMAGTAGQVYAAALLDDKKTLAVGAGWVNAGGRTLCGIVLLEKKNGDFVPKNAIVVRGSVRDVAAGPDNGFFVVTTDPWFEQGKEHLDVAFFGNDGQLRALLGEGYRSNLVTDEAENVAMETQLERTGDDMVAIFDRRRGFGNVYNVTQTRKCSAPAAERDDHFFLYPDLGAEPCYSSKLVLGERFVQPPEFAANKRSRLLRSHFSVAKDRPSVDVWTTFDAKSRSAVVATGTKIQWRANVNWQHVLAFGDGYIDALQQEADGYYRVRVEIPGGVLTPSPSR